jgi:2-C-methyl-D-erythritol 4-phosphate cytidylyltransferase
MLESRKKRIMNYALIVAAGKGTRMQSPVAKPYMPLAGVPILRRTLLAFDHCPIIDAIYLVISAAERAVCQREVIDPLRLSKSLTVVAGGDSRQASVCNGLAAMDGGEHWVGIHDGVRPFITSGQIASCFKAASAGAGCVLGIPVAETLKEVDSRGAIRRTQQRKGIWLAQTPQVFKLAEILEAHRDARDNAFIATDDAALMERIGRPVKMLPGSSLNMKITTSEDLKLAEAIVATGLHHPQSSEHLDDS